MRLMKLFSRPLLQVFAAASLFAVIGQTNTLYANSASMSQPNYNYFSGGISEYSNGQRGIHAYGQFEIQNQFFVLGKYEQVTRRLATSERSSQTIAETGIGRYFRMLDGTTADVSVTGGRLSFSQNVFNTGTNFYTLNTGISHREGAWELRGGYRYVDFSGENSYHGFVGSVFYYIAPQMQLGVQFNDVYGRSSYTFGARFVF